MTQLDGEFKRMDGFREIEANADGDVRWFGSKKALSPVKHKNAKLNLQYNPDPFSNKNNLSPYKMVATLFVPNPHNYKYVKTIDGDYTNFKANNLQWVKTSRG